MSKILFVIPTLGEGGAERVLVTLVNNLNKNKYDISVLSLFDVGINRKYMDPELKYLTCFPKLFRGNIHLMKLFSPEVLFRFFIRNDYDIIVSYLEGPTSRIVSGCPKLNTRIVNWVHTEIDSISRITNSYRSKKEAIDSYQRYDATVFVSRTARNSFISKFPQISKNLRVIYNSVDTNRIRDLSLQTIDGNLFDNGAINLVSVGRFTQQKGFDRLLKIIERLIRDGFNLHLYLIGKGELLKKYQEIIKNCSISDSVTIMGFLENPYKYVSKCDLFVCSSYREGYSTAVTESLIVGTPIITTLCSGMEELLGENNEYGIITENSIESLYLGIKKLLQDKVLLAKYKEKAIERGAQFSLSNSVFSVESFFDEIEESNL